MSWLQRSVSTLRLCISFPYTVYEDMRFSPKEASHYDSKDMHSARKGGIGILTVPLRLA